LTSQILYIGKVVALQKIIGKLEIDMKKSFSLIMLIFWFGQASPQTHTFFINDQTRQYYLHVPDSLPANAPLIYVLHGYSGSAQSIRNYSGMDQIADDSAFAVCYPQGLKDQWNCSFWNVGYDFHNNQTVDDVAFLTALAQYLQNEYNLSSQNTFCTGMSNGGDMCYLLACQAPDVFSAVAPVAGCMMEWIYNSCTPASPIPVFEIHGTDDDITYWNGDPNNDQGYGAYLSVPATFNFWAQLNSCAQYNLEILPNINAADGSYVVSEKYSQGIFNNEVWLYKVITGGHDWPGHWGNMEINASAEIWNFFHKVIQKTTNVSKRNENQISTDIILFQN